MNPYPQIHIEPPAKEASNYWGEFVYGPNMPWGPWQLTHEPKKLFSLKDITVLECLAEEYVEDEQGCAASRTLGHGSCSRHFLVAQITSGEILWWYNLSDGEYDPKNQKLKFTEDEVIIQNYGWGSRLRGEAHVNIETGAISR